MSQKTKKKKKKVDTSPNAPLFIGLVLAAVGGLWYLKKRSSGDDKKKKKDTRSTSGSAFRFPNEVKKSGALPRNKTNKKNKAKRRTEKAQKKAEKKVNEEKAAAAKKQEGSQASSSVINYTYFDTARRDTLIPMHKKPSLSAADVMKKDQEAQKKS